MLFLKLRKHASYASHLLLICHARALLLLRLLLRAINSPFACSFSQAYAPQYPVPKEERWFFVLADPTTVGWGCCPRSLWMATTQAIHLLLHPCCAAAQHCAPQLYRHWPQCLHVVMMAACPPLRPSLCCRTPRWASPKLTCCRRRPSAHATHPTGPPSTPHPRCALTVGLRSPSNQGAWALRCRLEPAARVCASNIHFAAQPGSC